MKALKMIIAILIIIFIVISTVLLYLVKNKNISVNVAEDNTNTMSNTVGNPNLENEDTFETAYLNKVELVDNRNKYFVVSNIINSYTNNNYIINKIYSLKKETNIDAFWIEGIRKDTATSTNLMVITDSVKKLFLIINEEQIIQNGISLENLNSINLENINFEENNKFEYKNINDEEYIKFLLKDYLEKTLYNTQLGYNILNEEYKNKKFGSIEKYNEFINLKREALILYNPTNAKQPGDFSSYEEWLMYFNTLKLLEVKEYSIKPYDGYTEYILVDTYDNYYIFNETSVMNYELMLDTYTIGTSTFLEEYSQVTEDEKVELNINKLFDAINKKDYNYVYNKLDIEYKTTNFSDFETFKIVMENNFFKENLVEFDDYTEEGNIYKYFLTITNKAEKDTTEKEVIITMQLGENTDFTVKFE